MIARLLLLLAIAINLVAATAPFRLDPPRLAQNRLEHGQDGALVFHDSSMARTISPPAWLEDAIKTGALSIDLRVRPASSEQGGPARILTISEDYTSQDLMIGQEQSDLVIRIRRPGAHSDGEPAFIVPGVFETGSARDILVQIEPGHLQVGVDQKPVVDRQLPENALGTWDKDFNLALGNEVIGRRAWNGVIYRATISTPAHRDDLLAVGKLQAPKEWWEVPHRLGVLFEVDLPLDALVAFLHFLAFMPIGYAAFQLLSRREALPWLLVLVLALAIGIEASKVLIEDRHPTILNLMGNFSGGLAGILLASRFTRFKPKE